ncbi:MAG: zeta toxin family protein [Acidobacteriota bacterium]|nr:zeta toxin family protein [Acidobacteriota bacterium]
MIAGPNGSGKTTLTDQLRKEYKVPLGQYINPDDIDQVLKSVSDPLKRSRLAQEVSTGLRRMWLLDGVSLSYESVMSHPSHLDFIREANGLGYKTYLYYICTNDSDVNLERVAERVISGGHPVPKEKVLSRYKKSLNQLCEMAKLCRRTYFFDNTNELTSFAEVNPNGFLDIQIENYYKLEPWWFREHVLMKWDKEKIRIITSQTSK